MIFSRSFAGCLFILTVLIMLARGPIVAEQPRPWVDRDLFPEAYSILTSDRIMFPDDITDWPHKIGSSRQLFVDDFLISDIEGLTRQFHTPVKYADNPLMPGGSVGVLHDTAHNQMRMWNGARYFTSTDGFHWDAPELGPNGNVVLHGGGDLRGFMVNIDLPEMDYRYKAVLEHRHNPQTNDPAGFYLYHSRDGLNWERCPDRPILQRSHNNMFPGDFQPHSTGSERQFIWHPHAPDRFQSHGVGDTSSFRYDPILKRYIFDGKFNIYMPPEKFDELGLVTDGKYRIRLRTFSESDDLIHWTPPRFMMFPDQYDPPDRHIYAHVGFNYESMWIGIIQTMQVQNTGWKQMDMQLSYSRDGRHWSRPHERQPFISLGDGDSWEADYSGTAFTAPVLKDNELFFYYFGSRNPARDDNPGGPWPTYVGVATLRQDGFASLNANDSPGMLITRPLQFTGNSLYVNAAVEEGGWIKAALMSRDSEPIAGYSLEEAHTISDDSTASRMTWKTNEVLVSPENDHHRIQFELKNAKLYAFWIE